MYHTSKLFPWLIFSALTHWNGGEAAPAGLEGVTAEVLQYDSQPMKAA